MSIQKHTEQGNSVEPTACLRLKWTNLQVALAPKCHLENLALLHSLEALVS